MNGGEVALAALVGALTASAVEAVKHVYDKARKRHDLRLETEYEVLRDLWKKAYWVKSRANVLGQSHESNPDFDKEEVRTKRLTDFEEALEGCSETIFLNKPFYPDDIFAIAKQLADEATLKVQDFAESRSRGPIAPSDGFWSRHREFESKINDLVEQLCSAIRRHMSEHESMER